MEKKPKDLVSQFFDNTASSYDFIVKWTTFGKDNYWKEEIIKKIPSTSNSILELACGTGILTKKIAENFPNSRIVGVDITETYLNIAKKRTRSLPNVIYIFEDAEKINLNEKFDCITSSYIPKYCDVKILIEKCLKHLKPNGIIILHDFLYPKNHLFQKIWKFYFKLLKVLGNFIPEWKNVFIELPKLIEHSAWIEDFENTMKKNNILVEKQILTWRTAGILSGRKII